MPLYAAKNPDGKIEHSTLSSCPDMAALFCLTIIFSATGTETVEDMKKLGYTIVQVTIVENTDG